MEVTVFEREMLHFLAAWGEETGKAMVGHQGAGDHPDAARAVLASGPSLYGPVRKARLSGAGVAPQELRTRIDS
jgi:hypothetical protein